MPSVTAEVLSPLTFAGRGTVDFGIADGDTPLPSGFSCVLMTYAPGAITENTSVTWNAAGTGMGTPAINAMLTAKDGKVTVTLCSGGTILSIR